MKRGVVFWILAIAIIIILGTFSCAQPSSTPGSSPSPSPSPTLVSSPSAKIVSPQTGAGVPAGDVEVVVDVTTNFKLVDKLGENPVPGEGHIHYYMDVEVPTTPGQPAVTEQGTYAVGMEESHIWKNIEPGQHTFAIQLVNNDHTPLDPPVFAQVTITVEAPVEEVSVELSANNLQFDKDTIIVPAGATVTINFNNGEAIPHNFALYESSSATEAIFVGEIITGPGTIEYRFKAPGSPGTYFFRCDIHPTTMTGDFVVVRASIWKPPVLSFAGEHDPVWNLKGMKPLLIGGYGNNLCYDGKNIAPLDGEASILLDAEKNTGTMVVNVNGTIHPEKDKTYSGDIKIVYHIGTGEGLAYREGGVADFVYLHGDTKQMGVAYPKIRAFLAAWGTADVYVNEELVYENIWGHMMYTEGFRDPDTKAIYNRDRSGYYDYRYPTDYSIAASEEKNLHMCVSIWEGDSNNLPPNTMWIMLLFQEVADMSYSGR